MKCRHCGCELLVSALATLSLRPNRFAGSNPFASQSLLKKPPVNGGFFINGRRHLGKIPTLIQPRFHLDEL